jgi:hypothetical protein
MSLIQSLTDPSGGAATWRKHYNLLLQTPSSIHAQYTKQADPAFYKHRKTMGYYSVSGIRGHNDGTYLEDGQFQAHQLLPYDNDPLNPNTFLSSVLRNPNPIAGTNQLSGEMVSRGGGPLAYANLDDTGDMYNRLLGRTLDPRDPLSIPYAMSIQAKRNGDHFIRPEQRKIYDQTPYLETHPVSQPTKFSGKGGGFINNIVGINFDGTLQMTDEWESMTSSSDSSKYEPGNTRLRWPEFDDDESVHSNKNKDSTHSHFYPFDYYHSDLHVSPSSGYFYEDNPRHVFPNSSSDDRTPSGTAAISVLSQLSQRILGMMPSSNTPGNTPQLNPTELRHIQRIAKDVIPPLLSTHHTITENRPFTSSINQRDQTQGGAVGSMYHQFSNLLQSVIDVQEDINRYHNDIHHPTQHSETNSLSGYDTASENNSESDQSIHERENTVRQLFSKVLRSIVSFERHHVFSPKNQVENPPQHPNIMDEVETGSLDKIYEERPQGGLFASLRMARSKIGDLSASTANDIRTFTSGLVEQLPFASSMAESYYNHAIQYFKQGINEYKVILGGGVEKSISELDAEAIARARQEEHEKNASAVAPNQLLETAAHNNPNVTEHPFTRYHSSTEIPQPSLPQPSYFNLSIGDVNISPSLNVNLSRNQNSSSNNNIVNVDGEQFRSRIEGDSSFRGYEGNASQASNFFRQNNVYNQQLDDVNDKPFSSSFGLRKLVSETGKRRDFFQVNNEAQAIAQPIIQPFSSNPIDLPFSASVPSKYEQPKPKPKKSNAEVPRQLGYIVNPQTISDRIDAQPNPAIPQTSLVIHEETAAPQRPSPGIIDRISPNIVEEHGETIMTNPREVENLNALSIFPNAFNGKRIIHRSTAHLPLFGASIGDIEYEFKLQALYDDIINDLSKIKTENASTFTTDQSEFISNIQHDLNVLSEFTIDLDRNRRQRVNQYLGYLRNHLRNANLLPKSLENMRFVDQLNYHTTRYNFHEDAKKYFNTLKKRPITQISTAPPEPQPQIRKGTQEVNQTPKRSRSVTRSKK